MAKKNNEALATAENGHSPEDRDTAMLMLGAARYAGHIHDQTKSDLVRFCQSVRDQKHFLEYGCSNFDEWLDSPMSPFKQRTFYREENLYLTEGGEQYDLFNELRIPATVRRQLTSGDIAIDGDEAIVGDERISLSDGGVGVKKLVERLVKDKIEAEQRMAATGEEVERLRGIKEKYDKLCNELNETDEEPPFVTAMMLFLKAFMTLIAEVNALPGELKAERAEDDLDHIGELMDQLSRAFGEGVYTPKRLAKRSLENV